MAKASRLIAITAAIALGASCAVHQDNAPSLAGPSGLALTITVTATPDHITQNGADQAQIKITAIDASGRPKASESVRVDMVVGGALEDYGTLSARSLVTGSDGTATTVYTAPPAPPANLASGTTYVGIRATPIGSDAQGTSSTVAYVNLVPPGVILGPGQTPTPSFTVSPTPVNVGTAANFDASASCAAAPPCSDTTGITSFAWSFGDGGSGTGKTTTHTFTSQGGYSVTLTVVNDRGIAASTTQTVTATAGAGPKAAFIFSPASPIVNSAVQFDASPSTSAVGHNITQYNWSFGDGNGGTGLSPTHTYTQAGTYNVALSVLDDTGQRDVTTKSVTVGTGNPVPAITFSPTSPTHAVSATLDASGTQFSGGATGVTYAWQFGDGANASTGVATTTHTWALAGTYTVTLTVTDSSSRTGIASFTVTVQ